MTRLSVNVDHIATVREARGASYPSPVEAARLAEGAGASGITVHLRSDRRHIQDRDVEELHRSVRGKLNLEMATTDEMIAIATKLHPHQVTLVPERDGEVTTEGGLDLKSRGGAIEAAARALAQSGVQVSLFLDPDVDMIARLADWDLTALTGFEINTDHYTRATNVEGLSNPTKSTVDHQLQRISDAVAMGTELGLEVYAGHGLTTYNVGPIAANPAILELNIGHWLVARSTLVGIATAVEEMLDAMHSSLL